MTFISKPDAFVPAQPFRLGDLPGCLSALPVPPTSLAEKTLAALKASFSSRNHFPSEEMWTALKAIANTLESMANSACTKAFHLSSLDPGIGKTTTVIHFLNALMASPGHAEAAALVCVKRRDQIEAIVKEAGLGKGAFAVLTAHNGLNSLGASNPKDARVLFTTQSMVEMRSQGRLFANVAAFHYRGQPRAVRIWDEAILPGRPLTVSRDMIAFLFTPLRGHKPLMVEALEDLFTELRTAKDGSLHYLPDLGDNHSVDLNEALRLVHGGPQEQVQAVEALWYLFGRCVTIRQDGIYGNTLLDYRDTLPEDITPLLVLDASVRVRTAYKFWEKRRGGIQKLPSVTKRYDNGQRGDWVDSQQRLQGPHPRA